MLQKQIATKLLLCRTIKANFDKGKQNFKKKKDTEKWNSGKCNCNGFFSFLKDKEYVIIFPFA